jgi:hypothetical protein
MRRVLIAKQDDLRRRGSLNWWGKCWNWLLGISIKHGYIPHRILFAMVLFVCLGTVLFGLGFDNGLMSKLQSVPNGKTADADYPKFQPFVYSIDTFLPIIDFKAKGLLVTQRR